MSVPPEVLSAFDLAEAGVSPITRGLINATFRLDSARGRFVLQRVSPIFPVGVHEDIQAVTEHLAAKGWTTPRIEPTRGGALYFLHEGAPWRCLSFVEGVTHDRLLEPRQAREAGALLGRFQAALLDLSCEWKGQRLGVHDTDRHVATLERALAEHATHPLHAEVSALAEPLLRHAAALPRHHALAPRVVHGDPKINNIIFDARDERGLCFVDLDTVGPMPLPLELGDAFRSWCNPAGEDAGQVRFDLPLFRAAIDGYASVAVDFINAAELGAISSAIPLIIVELATRFAADALNESYFGWDPARFPSRGAHNLARARVQHALAESYLGAHEEVDDIIGVTFRRASAC